MKKLLTFLLLIAFTLGSYAQIPVVWHQKLPSGVKKQNGAVYFKFHIVDSSAIMGDVAPWNVNLNAAVIMSVKDSITAFGDYSAQLWINQPAYLFKVRSQGDPGNYIVKDSLIWVFGQTYHAWMYIKYGVAGPGQGRYDAWVMRDGDSVAKVIGLNAKFRNPTDSLESISVELNDLVASHAGNILVSDVQQVDTNYNGKIRVIISSPSDSIQTNGGTLAMTAAVSPTGSLSDNVTWSVSDTMIAKISASGELEAFGNGDVIVTARSVDNTYFLSIDTIHISGQVLVDSIHVTSSGNATTIDVSGGDLQMSAEVLPADARIKNIIWSVVKVGGANATINTDGLLHAIADGIVYAKAASIDGSNISDSMQITISNQVGVDSVLISGNDTINTDGGTTALTVTVYPADASDKRVEWSIISDDADTAVIDISGNVTAIRNGKVTVRATSLFDNSKFGEKEIVIINQVINVDSIVVTATGGATTISVDKGTLQMHATAYPTDAADKTVTWSVSNNTLASINSSGLLTAIKNGSVWVKAVSTDGGKKDSVQIAISNQIVLVTSITVNGGATITTKAGTLNLTVTVLPANATNKTVSWSSSNTAVATVSSSGVVTAVTDGTTTITASANDASGITGTKVVTVSNQSTGIKDNLPYEITYWPNPVYDMLTISCPETIKSVLLYGIDGKVVLLKTFNSNQVELNVNGFNSGLYLIKVQTSKGMSVKSIVICK